MVLVMMWLAASESAAQVRPNTSDIYYLFYEEKVFHPKFGWNARISLKTDASSLDSRRYEIRLSINDRISSVRNTDCEVHGNNLYLWFRDREGGNWKITITLKPDGSMQMYIPPMKTKMNEVLEYINSRYFPDQHIEREAWWWIEPTDEGFSGHKTRSKEDANHLSYYSTGRLSRSFDEYISDGYKVLKKREEEYQEMIRLQREENRRREEERKRREEERRRLEEERRKRELERQQRIKDSMERDKKENTVMVTVKSQEKGQVYLTMTRDMGFLNRMQNDSAYVRIAKSIYGTPIEGKNDVWEGSLCTGKYNVRAEGYGYEPMIQEIEVTKDSTEFLLERMTPLTTAFKFKTEESLQDLSETGFEVYVNGYYAGNTPVTANVMIWEPNKVEYKDEAFRKKTFWLTINGKVASVSKSPTSKSEGVSGVTLGKNNTVTAKLKRGRKGAITKEGNFYIFGGVGATSYPSLTYGGYIGITVKHFCLDLSLYRALMDTLSGAQTGFRLGAAFPIKCFRITPYAGMNLDILSPDKRVEKEGKTTLPSFPIGLKTEFALFGWVVMGLSPEISYYIKEKRWVYGLRVHLSLSNVPLRKSKKDKSESTIKYYNNKNNNTRPYMNRRYSPVPMRRR